MPLYQIASRWAWWNALTYNYKNQDPGSQARGLLEPGVRVRIPLGKGSRVGFVLDKTDTTALPEGAELKEITVVLDQSPVLPPDLWDLALWMSRTFLCSVGTALWSICPKNFLDGEPVTPAPDLATRDDALAVTPSPSLARDSAHAASASHALTRDDALAASASHALTRDDALAVTPSPSHARDGALAVTPSPSHAHDNALASSPTPARDSALDALPSPSHAHARDDALAPDASPSLTRDDALTVTPSSPTHALARDDALAAPDLSNRDSALAALAALAARYENQNKNLTGTPNASGKSCAPNSSVRERNFFDTRDDVRWAFYRDLILSCDDRTLVLFSDEIAARKFFDGLQQAIQDARAQVSHAQAIQDARKQSSHAQTGQDARAQSSHTQASHAQTGQDSRGEIILWPSTTVRKKGASRWDAWLAALNGDVRVIVGPPAAVFAPLHADRIIVDDEASPGYMLQYPTCHARSLAGRRAMSLGAELVLGGRMHSGKTFSRIKHKSRSVSFNLKNSLVLADLKRSIKVSERGVEGELPVTIALLQRTRETLANHQSVIWMLDRKGGALEVFCSQCGHAITCPKCGGLMRSVRAGQNLKCYRCGRTEILPERCPKCKGQLWTGKRPGLESLKGCAEKLLFPGKGERERENIYLCEGRPTPGLVKQLTRESSRDINRARANLILGTRGALLLCDVINVGLIGWLDIDSELRRLDYDARFNAFNMIWDSLWRGSREQVQDQDGEINATRTVLLQCRRCEAMQRELNLSRASDENFWRRELASRSELELPPAGLLVEINLTRFDNRREFIRTLEGAGLFVMDPGEADQPLWIPTHTIAPVAQALAPRFNLTNVRMGYPTVIVHSE